MKFNFDSGNHKLMIDDINATEWESKHFLNNEHNTINIELGEFVYLLDENILYITSNKNNVYNILNIIMNENRDILDEKPDNDMKVELNIQDFINIKDLIVKDYNQFFKDYPDINIELLYLYNTGIGEFYKNHWESDSWKNNEYNTILEWDITKTEYSEKVIESFSLIDNIKELKIE